MPFRRAWVFLLLPILPLAAALSASDANHTIDRRFAAEKARVWSDCRAFRAARDGAGKVCSDDEFGGSLRFYKRGTDAVDAAVSHARAGDVLGFGTEMARAIDACNRADDQGSLIATLSASSLMKRILDTLEANPGVLDLESRRTLLARAHLRSAAHPFDAARIDQAWWTFQGAALMPLPFRPVEELRAMEAVRESDLVLGAMDRAIGDGDVARCKQAAEARTTKRGPLTMLASPEMCTKIADARATGRRLEEAKSSGPRTSSCLGAERATAARPGRLSH